MNAITYNDLYKFNFLSGITVSPNKKHAFFFKHQAKEAENSYETQLWLMDCSSKKYQLLVATATVKHAFWLDDTTIVYTTKQKQEEYIAVSISDFTTKSFMTLPTKVNKVVPLNANIFLCESKISCQQIESKSLETPALEEFKAKEGEDFYIFDEIPFWFNGKGVGNKTRNTLFLYNKETNTVEFIGSTWLDITAFSLSPDKTKVLYSGTIFENMFTTDAGLYLYDIKAQQTKTIAEPMGNHIDTPIFVDNDTVFYTNTTYEWSGRNPHYYILNLQQQAPIQAEFPDALVGNSIGTDANYGTGKAIVASNGMLYYLNTRWSHTEIVAMKPNGQWNSLYKQKGSITGIDIAGEDIFFTAFENQSLAEIYTLKIGEATSQPVTSFNTAYHQEHKTLTPEAFTYESKNGYIMEGFVIKPANFEKGKSYPAVFEMHGGPKAVFGDIFHHEMQCLAHQGYFVFYMNPRGSDGRGEKYADITGNLGKIDFDDFMEFADQVLARNPEINQSKVGICGGSYGGFMCNWMIGHTDRFAAAASQRSISNYFTKSLCTDIGFYHNMLQLKTNPWENHDEVWERSPLKEAHKAKTPTLLIQSDEDYRCWMSDAIQMFSALKQSGTPTRMALFHGENHELSRSGKPKNRIKRLEEIGNWFAEYLL